MVVAAALAVWASPFGADLPGDPLNLISLAVWLYIVIAFWFRNNWARILLLLACVYAMLRVVLVTIDPPLVHLIILITQAGLSVPLLIWLNSKRIRQAMYLKVS